MKQILTISLNEDGQTYSIAIGEGMSLQEVTFGIAAMIKCLIRDNIIENSAAILTLLNKYLTDSQYNEIGDRTCEK